MAKQKQGVAPEVLQELQFPLLGIDVSEGNEIQRGGTTQVGDNVRACEPSTFRIRGGARAGLSKYVPEILPVDLNKAHVVQHLAVVVDPTTDAILASFPDVGPTVADPSTSNLKQRLPVGGRMVRKGGSGKQPNIKVPKPVLTITANNQSKATGATFTFAGTEFTVGGLAVGDSVTRVSISSIGMVASAASGTYRIRLNGAVGVVLGGGTIQQKYRITYISGTMTVGANIVFVQARSSVVLAGITSLAFNSNVTVGNLLLFMTGTSNTDSTATVTDNAGNVWTFVPSPIVATARTGMFWAIANATGPITVTIVEMFGGTPYGLMVAEYSGVNAVPFDGSNKGDSGFAGTFSNPLTTNVVPVVGSNELLVGSFTQRSDNLLSSGVLTAGVGFTKRTESLVNDILGTGQIFGVTLIDNTNVSVGQAATATVDNPINNSYGAVGASFEPA